MLSRRWLLFALVGLAVGLLLATQRVQATDDEPLEPLGLPGVREYLVLAVDGRDPKVLLLGTERGVFRTRDGGVHWVLAGLDGRKVSAIVARESAYVAGDGTYTARSDDRGRTWRIALLASPHPTQIVAHPRNPKLLLSLRGDLLRSTDGGKTWLGTELEAATAAWSPSESKVAYAISTDGQLYRSGDAGATWQVAG